MLEKIRATFSQLYQFWSSLGTGKRVALITLTSAVLVAVLAISVVGSRERYGYLYTDLAADDAAAMVDKLKTQQVPYRLENGGTTIQVPEDRVAALRLELAASGLPRGGNVGFELFDRSRLGATEFEQHVHLRRALEGELARSIMSIQGVKAARVHLVLPERRLFVAREETASASIVVKLANSANFGRREVAAVVHLVSTAVPGLSKERVSLVSTEGLTLHRPSYDGKGPDGAGGDSNLSEQARLLSSQLESEVQQQLERVVGTGNADARVAVELNPSVRERTEELYEPSKTALRSEQQVVEVAGGKEAGVAGVPGARSNLPDAADGTTPAETASAPGSELRRSHTRNWEVQRVTDKTTTPAGDIRRISVGVVLNGRYEQRDGKPAFVARGQEELKNLEEVVKRTVGFNAERGDSVSLQTAEFTRLESDLEGDVSPPYPWWLPFAVVGGLAAVLVSVLVLAVRSNSKKKAKLEAAQAKVAAAAPALPPLDHKQLLQAPLDQGELRAKALEVAAKDPGTAAVVLRQWLSGPSKQVSA